MRADILVTVVERVKGDDFTLKLIGKVGLVFFHELRLEAVSEISWRFKFKGTGRVFEGFSARLAVTILTNIHNTKTW